MDALLTDLYQLTMAYGYWKAGVAEREAVFHLTFRRAPFGGAYAIAAGIEPALEYLEALHFTESDLAYLATLGLFDADFLAYLGKLRFTCTVDAVPEGTIVFPHEPLVRVTGPVLAAQIVETPLLNMINFQTLVATKAARVVQAARGAPVLEFGLRRAQGPDGGVCASRAAYIGGCVATSNVLAGKTFGIPVKGTHAHSWVMFHGSELDAFRIYARAMPGNCTFLVDTYDTLDGVRHAIEVGRELRASGHELAGVRLDSGDLALLSIEARKLLDEGGFPDAKIVASNDLDEVLIGSLLEQGARIDIWGVGTKLATAYDQPALGGVYKLGSVEGVPKIKLSEQAIKTSDPGILDVTRYRKDGAMVADLIHTAGKGPSGRLPDHDEAHLLLEPRLRTGARVREPDSLVAIQARAQRELSSLSPWTRRFLNPTPYPVELDRDLAALKEKMIAEARR